MIITPIAHTDSLVAMVQPAVGSIATLVVTANTPGVILESLVLITATAVAAMANTMVVIIKALAVMHQSPPIKLQS